MYAIGANRRRGVSLLEALIATVVLLVALAALTSQAQIGMRAANRTRLQAVSRTIAQTVLAEQLASVKLTSSAAMQVPDHSGWMMQTWVEPVTDAGAIITGANAEQLCLVSVAVWQTGRYERLSKTTLSQIARRFLAEDSRALNSSED